MNCEAEKKRIVADWEATSISQGWKNLSNTAIAVAIGAALAWWAYGTVAHTVLFAFIVFAIAGTRDSIIDEIRRTRLSGELRQLEWREQERLAALSELVCTRRAPEELVTLQR